MDDGDGIAVAPVDDTHEDADHSQEDEADKVDAPSEDTATAETVEASPDAADSHPPSPEPSSVPVIQEEKHDPEESVPCESDTEKRESPEHQLDEEFAVGSSSADSLDSSANEASPVQDEPTTIDENDTVEQEQTEDEEEREQLPSQSQDDHPVEQDSSAEEAEPMDEDKQEAPVQDQPNEQESNKEEPEPMDEEKQETPVQDTGTLIDEGDERTKENECNKESADVGTTSFIKHRVNGVLTNESSMPVSKVEQREDGERTPKTLSEEIDEGHESFRDDAVEQRKDGEGTPKTLSEQIDEGQESFRDDAIEQRKDGEGTPKTLSEEIDEGQESFRDDAIEQRMDNASDEQAREVSSEGENSKDSTDSDDEQVENMDCDEALEREISPVSVKGDQTECDDMSGQEEREVQSHQPLERRLAETEEERQLEYQRDIMSSPENYEDPKLLGAEEEEQSERQGVIETLLDSHTQDDDSSSSLEPRLNGNVSHNEGEEVGHEDQEGFDEPESSGLKRPRSVSSVVSNGEVQEPFSKQLRFSESFQQEAKPPDPMDKEKSAPLSTAVNVVSQKGSYATTELLLVSGKLDQSVDSGKSSLGDSNEPEEDAVAVASELIPSEEKVQEDPQSVGAGNIEDDDLDEDKSSSSSSTSSSSSSSDSDSSDDEQEDESKEDESNKHEPDQQDQLDAEHAKQPDEKKDVGQEENDSQPRLEIDSPSEEEEDDDEEEDEEEAKITRSEGLKLSISLKRPPADERPREELEQLPPIIQPTIPQLIQPGNAPVQPQPVDFSNFFNHEKLLVHRPELIKIDYTSKPEVHNISDQVQQEMESSSLPAKPTPTSGGFSLLNNQLKTNYLGVDSTDFLMDESSDTLDEENRLVIAEKQRRGRKKDSSPVKQQQTWQQQQQALYGGLHQLGMQNRIGMAPKSNAKRLPQQQQRLQQSLMKSMLASSKLPPMHLPVPPAIPAHQIPPVSSQQSLLLPSLQPQLQPSLQQQQPPPHQFPSQQAEKKKDKKKVFLCSPCGTHYENWNLFKHMREVHKKYICLYCLGIFQSADKLVNHLEAKHQVRKKHVASIDEYQQQQQQQNVDISKPLYLMCARCEHIFEKTPSDNGNAIVQHDCADYLERCGNCGDLKQSKHKCEKKAELPPDPTRLFSTSTLSSGNNIHSSVKFNLNNNYDGTSASSNSTAVMFNYDNHTTNGNGTQDNLLYQANSLVGGPGVPPAAQYRKSQNKKLKLSHPQQQFQHFNSPILQSQLMKPLEAPVQLPAPVSYPAELLQQQHLQQSYLLQHPPPSQLSFSQSTTATTTLSTIPASLLNVQEAPTELPPVPTELPPSVMMAQQQQQEQKADEQQIRPPLVPKLKVKIPKQYCTPIESEESSTESDYEDEEAEEDDEEEEDDDEEEKQQQQASEGEPLKTNEVQAHPPVPEIPLQEATTFPTARIEDDVKLDPVEMDIEEEGDRQPVSLPPEMGPAPMPEHHRQPPEPMAVDDELSPQADTLPSEPEISPPEAAQQQQEEQQQLAPSPPPPTPPPSDGIVIADEDAQLFELTLDEPLDKIHIREFIKICLRSTVPFCLYCNHARRIAVNGKYLALHLVATHRFQATVNSITAEELLPATIVQRFKSCLDELEPLYFNLETFDSSWTPEEKAVTYPKQFECFQCRFITKIHKELYLHNRKMHQKSVLICLMCRTNFFSYSELLCHMCPGAPNRQSILDYSFRCCTCNIDGIPSAFRLMVHLRKRHFACDVCLEQCVEQGALSNHVWKHKLHHLCYRCGIAYRNKADILKHLFWKHGTEGVVCKRCLQKKWPHVYHFCVPPAQFICEVCQTGFRKSLALKVHQRLHNGEDKYPCTEDGCEKKFISKKLLLKHVQRHYEPPPPPPSPPRPKEPTPEPVLPPEVVKPKEEEGENVKEEVKIEGDGESKIKKVEVKVENAEETKGTPRKKKKKRSKEDQEKSLVDLMNLPALNLSESDSSEDSDADHSNASSRRFPSAPGTCKDDSGDEGLPEQPKKEEVKVEEEDDNGPEKAGSEEIVNIWNNFKNYQASRTNSRRPSLSDEVTTEEQFVENMLKSKILHVSQSDHDYCRMYKKIYPEVKASEIGETIVIDDDGNLEKGKQQASLLKTGSPSKKQKSPRKRKVSKSGSDSSSSGSGSDSDSSCECGSNCSCSSSSSGSSSSSSDDSDSSDDNATKKKKKTSAKKEEKEPKPTKAEEPVVPVEEELPVEPPEPIDPDTVIHESDLETDESETDEEFYDDHPQKLANQMLAEKRRQLMQQTCMSPMNSFGIVENSRPSTPSLPEEMVAKKKVKLKKRKRERKLTKKTPPPPLEPIYNIPPALNLNHVDQFSPALVPLATPLTAPPILHSAESPPIPNSAPSDVPDHSPSPRSASKGLTPRLSTGNSSESDAPLKRSQRSRKPNKFYGYTSDDEGGAPMMIPMVSKNPEKSILSVMKPTPPPNLVWSKEDLPSPPSLKMKSAKVKQPDPSTPLTSRGPPTIAAAALQQQSSPHRPPRVDPGSRIPTVPVHHLVPSPLNTPLHNDTAADSDSSQEGTLQISHKPPTKSTPRRPPPPLPKLKLSVPKKTPSTSRGTPKTPASRKRAPPKPKTPKSAPPISASAAARAQISSSVAPPSTAPASTPAPFQPPIVDPAVPKVPPLGSFPSIQSEFFPANQIRIPAGWRPPREGESVYCYCRCPYDEVSEMIACDGDNCRIEWFHFECVGIIMPPKGKWFCPECKLKQQQQSSAAARGGGAPISTNAVLQEDLLDST